MNRRQVLRGAGALLPLPLLASSSGRASARPPVRVAFLYVPNGVRQDTWLPTERGPGFALPPSLAPLAPVREHMSLVSGLDREFAPGTEVHAQAACCWLTSSRASEPLDGPYPTNTTVDQLLARRLGTATVLPSLELSCNDFADNRESRYFETLSWYGPGHAADAEREPRAVFRRLFGGGGFAPGTPSVLDAVLEDARVVARPVGRADRDKLDAYMTSVRALELRLAKTPSRRARFLAAAREPGAAPEDRGAYLRAMLDLVVLAFETDAVRVVTCLFDPERWDSPRHYHGVFPDRQNHHPLSHGASAKDRADAFEKLARIDAFHVAQLAYLVGELAARKQPDGSSLLDHSLVAFGSGMSDGDKHSYKDLSVLLAGRGGGRLRPRGHVRCPGGTPLANLWLTLMAAAGVPRQTLADGTGLVTELLT